MERGVRDPEDGHEHGRVLSLAHVLVAVALALGSFGCGQVTSDRAADGVGLISPAHEAGIIDINVLPDAGRDVQGSAPVEVPPTAGSGGGAGGAAGSLGATGSLGAGGSAGAGGSGGTAGMSGGAGTSGTGCLALVGCADGVCNVLDHLCVGCLLDSDCKKGKGKLCDPSTLTCVECRTDADCDGNKTCGTDGSCNN